MTIREYIEESTDEPVLFADGLDDALVGMTYLSPHRAVYSVNKIIDVLIRDGMPEPDAHEYFSFNIGGAYVGEHTPVFIHHP